MLMAYSTQYKGYLLADDRVIGNWSMCLAKDIYYICSLGSRFYKQIRSKFNPLLSSKAHLRRIWKHTYHNIWRTYNGEIWIKTNCVLWGFGIVSYHPPKDRVGWKRRGDQINQSCKPIIYCKYTTGNAQYHY